jgi:Zn-dependent protease with chaperone function
MLLAVLVPRLPAAQPASASPAANSTDSPTALSNHNPQPAYHLPPDKLAKAIRLSRIRNILDIAGSIWGIVLIWLLLATRAAATIEAWARRIVANRWLQGVLYFAAFFLIGALAALPLDLYGHIVERSYQISVQTWPSWFSDQGKALGLTMLVGIPAYQLFHRIARKWPRRYWFGIWLVSLPLLVLVFFVEPLVEPLFDHFEQLSKNHPALVQELEKIVARTGTHIPPDRMFLMDASAKTNGLNAYVSGLGATKRIVVWDTTAGRIPDDEVLFIFAHESGHYVLHHIAKGIACTAVALFFIFWSCAAFTAWLMAKRGSRWGAPDLESLAGFTVLLLAVSIAGFILQPVGNAISRHFEHQADIYGQEAIHGIVPDPQKTAVAAFNDLGAAWLEDPNPSPLIEFWLYNHPSTQQRAEFAEHYNPWANGGHGEFFAK